MIWSFLSVPATYKKKTHHHHHDNHVGKFYILVSHPFFCAVTLIIGGRGLIFLVSSIGNSTTPL